LNRQLDVPHHEAPFFHNTDADVTDPEGSTAKNDNPVDGIMMGLKTTPIAPQ
jgi:hypothetical protein